MISVLLAAAAFALPPCPATQQRVQPPRWTSENFSIDLTGVPDTRPGTWGNADFVQERMVFNPPAGYRVRILSVHGDFIAWPKTGEIPAGNSVEVGWGLKTTSPDGSSGANYGFDNTLVWIQDGLNYGAPRSRAAYDRAFRTGYDLPADNVLISQTFVAINTTGLTIHMEPTFTVEYMFVPASQVQQQ